MIAGPPRTKKNSSRILRFGRFSKVVPSAAYLAWRDAAVPQLQRQWGVRSPLARPLNCAALFLRDRLSGDAVGVYQGLADALEEARVVDDDKWVVAWDGSRLGKDAAAPRVELVLSTMEA